MDQLRIVGGQSLKGQIAISGAKNSALALMATSLLTDKLLHLQNVPNLADILSMRELLEQHGVQIKASPESNSMTLQTTHLSSTTAPYDLVRKMRASILVLGPLLARYGEARVSLPGGCVIGTRPVDLHLEGLRQMGADIALESGYIEAKAPKGLKGVVINMPLVSVGATENLMMAAALAKGETTIVNAAREPEIVDLAACLNAMGVPIEGAGTDKITIQGVEQLQEATHRVMPDRIETGTYIMAAAITNGAVDLLGTSLDLIPSVNATLTKAGVHMEAIEDGIRIYPNKQPLQGVDVMTEPFPGFATDLQAQMMALMSLAEGASMITETIFENRFMQVPELCRMGANITIHHSSALVRGQRQLRGAPVMATDLRASVCLVLAALAAEGETIINRVYHLDRGYEKLEDKLSACGADIERLQAQAA